jgi:hypothetical protein
MRFLAIAIATCVPVYPATIVHHATCPDRFPAFASAALVDKQRECAACRVAGPCATVAIEDVSVVDVPASAVRPHMTVIVEGDRIAAMGPASSTFPPKDARVVSGQGMFLIPGLWDMDVHLWYPENQLPVFVAFGVTGVQDTGSDFDRVSAWRKAIESGEAIGPHVVTSGPPVADRDSGDRRLPVLLARTAAEARQAFDRLWDLDTDFIEVRPELSRDAYFALAEMARHWNMRLTGPVPSSISSAEAIEARQVTVEGLASVGKAIATEPEALQFFERCATYGMRLSPALTLWRRMAHVDDQKLMSDPSLKYVPAAIRRGWAVESRNDRSPAGEGNGESAGSPAQVQGAYRLVRLMKRTKVEVLAGTHTGDPYTVPGATLHDELEQLVAAGLTPGQALETATLAPARLLAWDHAMGTVEKGKVADLVLLGANPLEDIRNTRKVDGVFTRGKYYSRTDLDAILAAVQ